MTKVYCLEMRDAEKDRVIDGYESMGVYSSREKALEALFHYSKEYSCRNGIWFAAIWEEEVDGETIKDCVFYDLNGKSFGSIEDFEGPQLRIVNDTSQKND